MSEIEDAVTIDRLTKERDALRTENVALHAQLNAQKEFLKDAIAPVYYRLAVAEVKVLAAERDALKVQANEAVAKRNEAMGEVERLRQVITNTGVDDLEARLSLADGRRAELQAEVERLKAAPQFDLVAHLERQRAFSLRTFGPPEADPISAHVRDHIQKELKELEANPHDLEEWIDVVLLGLDGAWRTGASSPQVAAALQAKQAKNEARTWPDWRTVAPGKAIEHVKAKCDVSGCPHEPEPNLTKCRAHEGGFEVKFKYKDDDYCCGGVGCPWCGGY